ncbi:hypothetical protein JKT64_11835 [Listeria monocytogenes]|uniref:HeH/LEM domain-containing protein n=1 Tax=Listeria TaxID=1637 RepID=UPI00098DDB7F|nr:MULTISPECIES: HeH/LEM domain-containing protein [Listeria]ECL7896704.1 hypothetical protein [Listeria innocua]WNV46858.1 hypothetical protein LPLmcIH18_0007 [Listeria phage LP-LmcIH1-8]WNV46925.1 hypothetical protein LPLmcIH19_0008 [Listeria phage LP-LmcIH1-9]EAC2526796.1 hypothetical protein [Listeria monocytogenes]EAC4465810.1 hypothetical protein [Listeria monocytogenes]
MAARSEETDSAPDNSQLTIAEIKILLDKKGIQYPSAAKKVELVNLLNEGE